MLLNRMWDQYNVYKTFEQKMFQRGYTDKDIYILKHSLNILTKLIELESLNVLKDLLTKRTYHRMLKGIHKGIEYLPNIHQHPENWILSSIQNDKNAWIDDNTLIFSTKIGTVISFYVFGNISRNIIGNIYNEKELRWE
jgi:hypothetical protein